jgi:AcrR family transcriptional regulator
VTGYFQRLGFSTTRASLKRRSDKANEAHEGSVGTAPELTLPATPANEKYQKILDAAVEVIAENGYFNAPISAIAARAGVADGTVYLYFKSKDEVLRTAIDRNFDRFHQRVIERFKDLHDPRE